jgi:hypothetical protein
VDLRAGLDTEAREKKNSLPLPEVRNPVFQSVVNKDFEKNMSMVILKTMHWKKNTNN